MYRISLVVSLIFYCSFSFSQSAKVIEKFKAEYYSIAHNNLVSQAYPITKWVGVDTITYFIDGNLEYTNEKKLGKYLSSLTELTDIHFQEISAEEDALLVIVFGDLLEYFNENELDLNLMITSFGTWYNIKYGKDRNIKSAKFCIDPMRIDDFKYGTHCVNRLFLNSLGLTGEIKNTTSIFRDEEQGFIMSRRDKQMLKLHYLEEVKPGMVKEDLEQLFESEVDLGLVMKMKL